MPTGVYIRKPKSQKTIEKLRIAALKQHREGRVNLRKKGDWKPTEEIKRKISETKINSPNTPRGKTHYMWKGNDASYNSIHNGIKRILGNANLFKCSCGKIAQHWSNIDHKYRRNVDDYKPMCVSCHSKYDDLLFKRWLQNRRLLASIRAKKQYKNRDIDSKGRLI